MNLVHCQKQLECHQYILKKNRFVKIIFIKQLRFVKAHEDVSNEKSWRRTHGYSIDSIIKLSVKNKMSLWCSAKEKIFLSSFLVIFRLGLWLKMRCIAMSMVSWSGILLKRLFTFFKICIFNLRKKRKSIFARVIISN